MWIEEKENGTYLSAFEDQTLCMVCEDSAEDLFIINKCGHIFCGVCMDSNARREWDEDRNEEVHSYTLDCRSKFSDTA